MAYNPLSAPTSIPQYIVDEFRKIAKALVEPLTRKGGVATQQIIDGGTTVLEAKWETAALVDIIGTMTASSYVQVPSNFPCNFVVRNSVSDMSSGTATVNMQQNGVNITIPVGYTYHFVTDGTNTNRVL